MFRLLFFRAGIKVIVVLIHDKFIIFIKKFFKTIKANYVNKLLELSFGNKKITIIFF